MAQEEIQNEEQTATAQTAGNTAVQAENTTASKPAEGAVANAEQATDSAAEAADRAADAAQEPEVELPYEVKIGLAASELVKKIDADQLTRPAIAEIIAMCNEQRQETVSLVETVEAKLGPAGKMPVQPLSCLLEWLVRDGALEEVLEIDGVPYEGTLEDAFNDENISDDSESLIYETTTDMGRLVAAQISPQARTAQLFEVEEKFLQGFRVVLSECNCEGGKSTKALEEALDAQGLLYRNERTNIPSVYPSMYANFLKDADCIAWNHAWITTDMGRTALEYLNSSATAVEE